MIDRNKLKLSNLEGSILYELEEAGSEEILTLVNTLLHSSCPKGLVTFKNSLKKLLEIGLVELTVYEVIAGTGKWSPIASPINAIKDLESQVEWDDCGQIWLFKPRAKLEKVEVTLVQKNDES